MQSNDFDMEAALCDPYKLKIKGIEEARSQIKAPRVESMSVAKVAMFIKKLIALEINLQTAPVFQNEVLTIIQKGAESMTFAGYLSAAAQEQDEHKRMALVATFVGST